MRDRRVDDAFRDPLVFEQSIDYYFALFTLEHPDVAKLILPLAFPSDVHIVQACDVWKEEEPYLFQPLFQPLIIAHALGCGELGLNRFRDPSHWWHVEKFPEILAKAFLPRSPLLLIMETFRYFESVNEPMATITINVNDEVAKRFRDMVKHESGEGKGVIGKTVEEALELWIKEKEQQDIAQRQMALMKKGFKLGKILYKSRGELYDRDI